VASPGHGSSAAAEAMGRPFRRGPGPWVRKAQSAARRGSNRRQKDGMISPSVRTRRRRPFAVNLAAWPKACARLCARLAQDPAQDQLKDLLKASLAARRRAVGATTPPADCRNCSRFSGTGSGPNRGNFEAARNLSVREARAMAGVLRKAPLRSLRPHLGQMASIRVGSRRIIFRDGGDNGTQQ